MYQVLLVYKQIEMFFDENGDLFFIEPFLKMRKDNGGSFTFIGAKTLIFDDPNLEISFDDAVTNIPYPVVVNNRGFDSDYGGFKFTGHTMSRLGVPVILTIYLYPGLDSEEIPVNVDIPIVALEINATTDDGK